MLAEWVLELGAEVHFGVGGTFERRRGRDVVQSRIDFAVASPDSSWTDEDADWLLSDHSSIGGSLVVGEVGRTDRREVVDWDRLAVTLADKDEGWYGGLVGVTAYDKLPDLRRKHLKLLRVCGRSKRWWNGEIAAQLHQQKKFGAPTHSVRPGRPGRCNAHTPHACAPMPSTSHFAPLMHTIS